MKRIIYSGLALTPSLLFLSCGSKETPQTDKPLNIIHIMTDDHSYQTISSYGHPLSKLAPTPNIDRLAQEGMLFQQAFVENSLSTPSRACLMTGLYSHQNGQRRLGAGIDTTKTFISEILQDNGYQTGMVGKWHMQCEPKGFDFYSVLWDQGNYYNPEFRTKETNGKYVKEEGYATHLTTDYALKFLNERDKEKPFCLFVHHKAPHRNWMPEEKYLTLYEDVEFPYPETFDDNYATREAASKQEMQIDKHMTLIYDLKLEHLADNPAYKNEQWRNDLTYLLNRMTPAQKEAWNKAYDKRKKDFDNKNLKGEELKKWKYQQYMKDYLRCIKTVDDEVGRLIAYLEKEGLMENTIIVYTSDQGFYMGEHGWFDKRFMYEESFRTPLIVRHPAKKKNLTSTVLVQNIDYAPTYLNVAGITKPEEMSGTSLVPLLDGDTPKDWRTDLYYHYYDYPAIHMVHRHDGVRTHQYKLINFYNSKTEDSIDGIPTPIASKELFDLQADPNELNNLYGKSGYEEITKHLEGRLEDYRSKLKVDEF